MSYRPFLLVCFLLWGMGCSKVDGGLSDSNQKLSFFDVESYFSGEQERLESAAYGIEKTLTLNGKSEVVRPDSLDFEKELSLFYNSGINKVSWQESYEADTVFSAQGEAIEQTTYRALEDKLRTRLVEVSYQNNEPQKIRIRNETRNIILKASQELVYEADRGFTIDQSQQLRFMSSNQVKVKVDFVQ